MGKREPNPTYVIEMACPATQSRMAAVPKVYIEAIAGAAPKTHRETSLPRFWHSVNWQAYCCPDADGFIYVLYSALRFASTEPGAGTELKGVECTAHGSGFKAYIREHLVANPAQEWFSEDPSDDKKWPDAWCSACDVFFQQQAEWSEKNEQSVKIKLLCHHCCERLRLQEIRP